MELSNCCILITGANGFIGKNLVVRLNELVNINIIKFLRGDDVSNLPSLIAQADAVIHLAGENRPVDEGRFDQVNAGLTVELCNAIRRESDATGRRIPIVLASSSQVEQVNPYGRSKLAAEAAVESLAKDTENPCIIFRLPGVFGKWCRPNYNSVVATFCHNIARDLPVQINDPATRLRLVYVDDVITTMLMALQSSTSGCVQINVNPEYQVNLGALVEQIRAFGDCRSSLMTERVGVGFVRALYATYISCLPCEKFSYNVPQHVDPRGAFVEILKTPDAGQFSYFTAYPGVTRGGHYHHTKTEKFIVIRGHALFRFRNLVTNELVEIRAAGSKPEIVDTIPGWSHDITNIGDDEMIVMLWANENFDRQKPDTVANKI